MALVSTNPYDGKVLREFAEFTEDEIKSAVSDASESFSTWKITPFPKRKLLMISAAECLRRNLEKYANIISSEMGKPISESRKEIEKCAWVCEYYAAGAEKYLEPETVVTDAFLSYFCYEPLGVVLGIMPWNFPFWQAFRFAVPTIMAGNTVVLKHASNVQGCAGCIEDIFDEAGFARGVYKNLVIGSARVAQVIEHPSVRAISLTGSEEAGRHVAETAGRNIKKTILELGGNNAFVVLKDADVEMAVRTGIQARMQNAGQSCISAKRFLVQREISEQFIMLLSRSLEALKIGDPLDRNTEMGPLSSVLQARKVGEQVERSVAMGAKLVAGGVQKNAFFMPTILTGVKPGMPVFDEEVFGPVVPVTVFDDIGEAVRLSNTSTFGLGVSVFTNDINKANAFIHEFEEGAVFVNELVKSDPRLPFGGIKNSGYGRELGIKGIREFVNVKTVYIKKI